jgi:hypothetical protein
MYNFDKEEMKALSKRLNKFKGSQVQGKDKLGFDFNDALPNSLKPKRLGSPIDLSG